MNTSLLSAAAQCGKRSIGLRLLQHASTRRGVGSSTAAARLMSQSTLASQSDTDSSRTLLATILVGGALASLVDSHAQNATNDQQRHVQPHSLSWIQRSVCEPAPSESNEEPTSASETKTAVETNDDEQPKEDPYDNLPEEDEPTDCSMCNTFRQGPCRPFWRKLERCFKDHEDEENGAVKCMDYFTPHQMCLVNYTNLYLLVGNEMKQDLIADVEESFPPEERQPLSENPPIDWSLYHEFLSEQGPDFRQTIPSLSENKNTPLWKRLPPDTEPVLISLETHLPNFDPSRGSSSGTSSQPKGWILKVAYALDQDGKVIGFQYNEDYADLLKAANDSGPEKESFADTVKMNFVVMPGETKEVIIKAYYSENPVDADPEKQLLDGCIHESSPLPVPTEVDVSHLSPKEVPQSIEGSTEKA